MPVLAAGFSIAFPQKRIVGWRLPADALGVVVAHPSLVAAATVRLAEQDSRRAGGE